MSLRGAERRLRVGAERVAGVRAADVRADRAGEPVTIGGGILEVVGVAELSCVRVRIFAGILDQRRAARPAPDELRGETHARLRVAPARLIPRGPIQELPERRHILCHLAEDEIGAVAAQVVPHGAIGCRARRTSCCSDGR